MDLDSLMDQVHSRLTAFQEKNNNVTRELLKIDENVQIIEDHVNEVRKQTKSSILKRCEQEQINAGLAFELEQLHEKQKMVLDQISDAETKADLHVQQFQEKCSKHQQEMENDHEMLNNQLKLLTDRLSN